MCPTTSSPQILLSSEGISFPDGSVALSCAIEPSIVVFLSTPCLMPLMLPNAQPGSLDFFFCFDSLAMIFGCWMCSLSWTDWEAGSWARCSEQKTRLRCWVLRKLLGYFQSQFFYKGNIRTKGRHERCWEVARDLGFCFRVCSKLPVWATLSHTHPLFCIFER